MICKTCGKEIPDGSVICTNCGAAQVIQQSPSPGAQIPPQPPGAPGQPAQQPGSIPFHQAQKPAGIPPFQPQAPSIKQPGPAIPTPPIGSSPSPQPGNAGISPASGIQFQKPASPSPFPPSSPQPPVAGIPSSPVIPSPMPATPAPSPFAPSSSQPPIPGVSISTGIPSPKPVTPAPSPIAPPSQQNPFAGNSHSPDILSPASGSQPPASGIHQQGQPPIAGASQPQGMQAPSIQTPISASTVESKPVEPVIYEKIYCSVCGAENNGADEECKYCKSPLKKPVFSSGVESETPEFSTPELGDLNKESVSPELDITQLDNSIETTPLESLKPDIKICQSCGHENPAMMLICLNCGEMLTEGSDTKPSIPATPVDSGSPINIQLEESTASQVINPDSEIVPAPAKQPKASEVVPITRSKICPQCNKDNPPGSFQCHHCGKSFISSDPSISDVETKPFLVCPSCYFRNSVDATECVKCGKTLKVLGGHGADKADQESVPEIGSSYIKCPVCGTENPKEVLSCKNCNYNFLKKKKDVIRVAPPEIPESDRIYCKRCGSENIKSDSNCRVCGEKLVTTETGIKIDAGNIPIPASPSEAAEKQTADFSFDTFDPNMNQPSHSDSSPPPVSAPSFGRPAPPPMGNSSVVPPPPFGGGGSSIPQASQPDSGGFVPEWQKKGSSPAKTEPEKKPKEKQKGKNNLVIIAAIIFIVVAIIAIIFLMRKGENKTPITESVSGIKVVKVDPTVLDNVQPNDSTSDNQASPTDDTLSIETVDIVEDEGTTEETSDTPEVDTAELIKNGFDAVEKNRITSPRNRNAYYYFTEARKAGVESTEYRQLQENLRGKLHTLGDKALSDKKFKDANYFYDLALKVDPDDPSVKNKKKHVDDLKRQDDRERNEYEQALRTGTIEAVDNFINSNPRSRYVAEARIEIQRLNRMRQEAINLENERKRAEDEKAAYENKRYNFNVISKYFLGENRGKLIITRKGVIFQAIDNREESFDQPYSNISSMTFEDDEVRLVFKNKIPQVGNEITFVHISENSSNTQKIIKAYNELRPK